MIIKLVFKLYLIKEYIDSKIKDNVNNIILI